MNIMFLPQSDIQSINNFCDTVFDGWFRPSLIMAVMVLTKTLAGRFARGVLHCCQRIEEAVAIIVLIREVIMVQISTFRLIFSNIELNQDFKRVHVMIFQLLQ